MREEGGRGEGDEEGGCEGERKEDVRGGSEGDVGIGLN